MHHKQVLVEQEQLIGKQVLKHRFTAVSGEGYFMIQGGAVTINLPAGSAGAIVALKDYKRNFATV